MPGNDQVTRQWFLMQKLEQSQGATVQELATSIPEDLSRHPRTIRRDLEALKDALVLPQSFISAMAGQDEQEFRQACIHRFNQAEALDTTIDTIKSVAIAFSKVPRP